MQAKNSCTPTTPATPNHFCEFDSILSSEIDSHLGLRSTLIGYQRIPLYCNGISVLERDFIGGLAILGGRHAHGVREQA